MKIIISVVAILVLLIWAPSAYAQSILSKHPQADYQSGLKWGIHDATDKHYTYLFQPGNGFINQTDS